MPPFASRLALLVALLALPAAQAQTGPDSLAAPPEASPADAPPLPVPRARPVPRPRAAPRARAGTGAHRLSGPRIGFTVLSPANVREINEVFGACDYTSTGVCERETVISTSTPFITQFGWQFERQMARTESGLAILAESVLLLGGLERGLALPSGSLIVGVRTPQGFEFGLGPNISATGAAYAVTAGFANPAGEINVPVNVAAVFGRGGPRLSLLVGLTFSDGRY